jgi:hypothetical protein
MGKISASTDGGTILTTDDIPAVRSGGNVRVKVKSMATQAADAVAITGGDIDDTAVGSTTPSTGAFTTLDASGAATITGQLDASGGDGSNASIKVSNAGGSANQIGFFIGATERGRIGIDNGTADFEFLCSTAYQFNGGEAKFGDAVTLSDGKLTVSESASDVAVQVNALHASFSSTAQIVTATRAANSAYSLLILQSQAGADNEFNFRGDGNGFADGSFTGGGADASEAMEWSDGNPDNEDRCGWTVVPDLVALQAAIDQGIYGKKFIRKAEAGEKPIGIVSGNAGVRMGHDLKYQGKYLRDKFNRYIYEEYTVTEWVEVIPAETEEVARTWQKPVMGSPEFLEYSEDGAGCTLITDGEGKPFFSEDGSEMYVVGNFKKAIYDEDGVPVYSFKGEVVWENGAPLCVDVGDVLQEAKEIKHSYESDKIPEGLTVPDDATVITEDENGNKLTRRKLNPDYDPEREHKTREDRQEWCDVNIAGFSPVLDGQVVNDRWVSFGKCGEGVTLYLVQ